MKVEAKERVIFRLRMTSEKSANKFSQQQIKGAQERERKRERKRERERERKDGKMCDHLKLSFLSSASSEHWLFLNEVDKMTNQYQPSLGLAGEDRQFMMICLSENTKKKKEDVKKTSRDWKVPNEKKTKCKHKAKDHRIK